ncbi:hypothetical protein [Kitasatospora sp. NPDC094015]|uniref:hypothetical protein n=1 Tax=Kitasatospora sp. NPDC094015 TaxID=3155205 RepID=UPI00331A0DCF
MSYPTPYPPPAASPYAPPYAPPHPAAPGAAGRGGGGGLIALGLLLLAQLAIELGVLAWDFSQAGPDYALTALGFSFTAYVQAPVGFFGFDTAFCVALAVLIVGAFNRARWTRPAAVVLLGANAYAAGALLISQGGDGFAEPVSHLVLNLTVLATLVLALAVAVLVGATRGPATTQPSWTAQPYPVPQGYQAPQAYPVPQQYQVPQPYPEPQDQHPYPGPPSAAPPATPPATPPKTPSASPPAPAAPPAPPSVPPKL